MYQPLTITYTEDVNMKIRIFFAEMDVVKNLKYPKCVINLLLSGIILL